MRRLTLQSTGAPARPPRNSRLPTGHRPDRRCVIPPKFIGLCIAATPDPTDDQYIIDRLRELGIRQARLDLTYPDATAHQERLLQRLLEERIKVCLHLVQPRAEARQLNRKSGRTDEALNRWREFIENTLKRFGSGIECVEVGATCNRRKWSGQSPAAMLRTWQVAWQVARAYAVPIIGPNVTDFEPVYNFYFLWQMRRMKCLPAIHTNNLFVERAVEPESFDHKILGRSAAGILRCNLIRKARILRKIGAGFDVPDFFCSHVAWSLRRIARFLEPVEHKQADYLARYLLLAAASGALQRVYWGPLIGQREGLIDDGTDEYPDPPHVTLYGTARGNPRNYTIRPAFHAMATVNKFLTNATFARALTPGPHLEILEFEFPDGSVKHAIWTTNGNCAAAADCYYPAALRQAVICDRDGRIVPAPPTLFFESPTYLSWNKPPGNHVKPNPKITGWRIARHAAPIPEISTTPDRRGIFLRQHPSGAVIDSLPLAAPLPPPDPKANDAVKILRVGRNQVWRRPAPWNKEQMVVIKQFKIPGPIRRLLDCRKPTKAERSWNGVQELLRRGINTPTPLACSVPESKSEPSYYVCDDFNPDCSARDIFTALATGESAFRQLPAAEWYALIAKWLVRLHDRGVFFRDLSAGNLLARHDPATRQMDFSLIDTARARFYPYPLPLRQRLSDLKRICHPLPRSERLQFITIYMKNAGRQPRWWMILPLMAYDLKHKLKNVLKPLRRRI